MVQYFGRHAQQARTLLQLKNRQTGYVGRTSGNFPDGTDSTGKFPGEMD